MVHVIYVHGHVYMTNTADLPASVPCAEVCRVCHMYIIIHTHKCTDTLAGHVHMTILAEYHLFYRALLQKRPMILKSLLIVATPYDIYGRLAICT